LAFAIFRVLQLVFEIFSSFSVGFWNFPGFQVAFGIVQVFQLAFGIVRELNGFGRIRGWINHNDQFYLVQSAERNVIH